MPEEKFSPEQSLQLIQSMIDKTKQNISSNSHYFLVWGWLTFAACVGQFILKHIINYEKHYLVWLVIFVALGLTIYFGIREGRTQRVKTFVGESMMYLWSGMGISFFVLSMILTKIGWGSSVYPFFITMYGLGTYVSGRFLKFKPLVIGGIISWVLAVVAINMIYDYQMLMGAAAILASYIIPGHLLQQQNLRNKT